MAETKTLHCDKCSKDKAVGIFSKNVQTCECGGVLKFEKKSKAILNQAFVKKPTNQKPDLSAYAGPPRNPLSPQEREVLNLMLTTDTPEDELLTKLEVPYPTPQIPPCPFEIGQKVSVVAHDFVVCGVKCSEVGFDGTVVKDLGFSQNNSDRIIRVRKSGSSKMSKGGMYDILMKYVTLD